jgi:hypothetical protein
MRQPFLEGLLTPWSSSSQRLLPTMKARSKHCSFDHFTVELHFQGGCLQTIKQCSNASHNRKFPTSKSKCQDFQPTLTSYLRTLELIIHPGAFRQASLISSPDSCRSGLGLMSSPVLSPRLVSCPVLELRWATAAQVALRPARRPLTVNSSDGNSSTRSYWCPLCTRSPSGLPPSVSPTAVLENLLLPNQLDPSCFAFLICKAGFRPRSGRNARSMRKLTVFGVNFFVGEG